MIGEVYGQGLFLGIELVAEHLNSLAEKTDYVINRMKKIGILMSSDGPDHNVIKIKPPITFTIENARKIIFYFHKVFEEDFMKQI
jgi:4-aminobutyrate aminotransferase-like enzyme